MLAVSSDYLAIAESTRSRKFFFRCKFDGMDEYIAYPNIANGQFTNSIDGNSILTMGNACANKLELTLRGVNTQYAWEGSKFTAECGLMVNGEINWVPWGTFWVVDMSTSNDRRTIHLTSYDFMYRLGKTKYHTKLVAPFHYRDLLDEFIEGTGLTLADGVELPDVTDADYIILSWPDGDFFYSDIAGHLAGMLGLNARISRKDPTVIEFVWYTPVATKIQDTLYQDGFERLADSLLRVDHIVTGSNYEIAVDNDDDIMDGELDFSIFDTPSAESFPKLIFTYDVVEMTATVALNPDYVNDTDSINIPWMISEGGQTYVVTAIAEYGFQDSKAEKILLPAALKSIGRNAFYRCTNITHVNVPASVTSVGIYAFAQCTSLIELYWNPRAISSIGSTGSPVFYKCSAISKVIIGADVTVLPNYFLRGCTGPIGDIVLPDALTTIGTHAFFDCTGLTSINIPANVVGIGIYAFRGCTSLATVHWDAISINSVGDSINVIFSACSGLVNFIVGDGVIALPRYMLKNVKSVASVVLPDSVTTIGYQAFYGCTGLISVQIGTDASAIDSIDTTAFGGCSALTDVTLYTTAGAVAGSPWGASNSTVSWVG